MSISVINMFKMWNKSWECNLLRSLLNYIKRSFLLFGSYYTYELTLLVKYIWCHSKCLMNLRIVVKPKLHTS